MAWSKVSRHQRGYGTAHDKMRALLIRTVITCEECARHGIETPGTIADHIIPLSRGGTGQRSNYQLLCDPCSLAKTLADKGAVARPPRGRGSQRTTDQRGAPVEQAMRATSMPPRARQA